MKSIAVELLKKSFLFLCIGFASVTNAQTTDSINISSSMQNINAGTTFNPWIVTNMTDQMKNALCVGNTDAWDCPSSFLTPIAPVAIGANAALIDPLIDAYGRNVWPDGSYLSCFNANTIFTPLVTSLDTTSCAMAIERKFIVCSNNSTENIIFNFIVNADNDINSITIDAGTSSAISLPVNYIVSMATSQVTIDTTIALANGIHTIDIVAADGEQPQTPDARYCSEENNLQLNPFGIAIRGTVSSSTSILLNTAITTVNKTIDTLTVCAGQTVAIINPVSGGMWSSSDEGVATVDQNGVATGVSPGQVTISQNIGQGPCAANVQTVLNVSLCHCEDSCSWSKTGNNYVHPWNFIGSVNNADFKIYTSDTQRINIPAAGIATTQQAYPNLVIAPDGTLYKGNITNNDTTTTNLQNRVNNLEAALKLLLDALGNYQPPASSAANGTLDISPTPFSVIATISYTINNFSGNAALQITDINGNLLKTIPITQASGQITIEGLNSPNTLVFFNIINNGQVVLSKKSILVNN